MKRWEVPLRRTHPRDNTAYFVYGHDCAAVATVVSADKRGPVELAARLAARPATLIFPRTSRPPGWTANRLIWQARSIRRDADRVKSSRKRSVVIFSTGTGDPAIFRHELGRGAERRWTGRIRILRWDEKKGRWPKATNT